MRNLPDIETKETKGYATFLASGYDTVKETFDLLIPHEVQEYFEAKRTEAEELGLGKGEGLLIDVGCEKMQISALRGAGGQRWYLFNDDFMFFIRSPKMAWCFSVQYRAGGLWEHGVHELKERVINILQSLGTRPNCAEKDFEDEKVWQRLSTIHFAFDFYSPRFTKAMTPNILENVVCHQAVKKNAHGSIDFNMWGKGGFLETLTIGSKKALQVQVYDKGKEITEASGKTWMVKLWEREGFYPPDEKIKDVWRLELRFAKEFLQNRGVLILTEFERDIQPLLTEALLTRRLTTKNPTDNNRSRWALHPLWATAFHRLEKPLCFIPLGKQRTQSDKAKLKQMEQSLAGTLRTMTVLEVGDYDDGSAKEIAERAHNAILNDKEHVKKVRKADEKFTYINDAR